MQVINPGHEYRLASYDGDQENRIVFMKREGEGYPFNVGHHAGTNCQEVIRALIDRLHYLQSQIPCQENLGAICHLRGALVCFEWRAARRHGRVLHLPSDDVLPGFDHIAEIEELPTCTQCGHVQCTLHGKTEPAPDRAVEPPAPAQPDERHEFEPHVGCSGNGNHCVRSWCNLPRDADVHQPATNQPAETPGECPHCHGELPLGACQVDRRIAIIDSEMRHD